VLADYPLSITTTQRGPYADSFSPDGLLKYSYRKGGPNVPENVGLRRALEDRVPLIYFHAVTKGQYLPAWPVFVVNDDRATETFHVAIDDIPRAPNAESLPTYVRDSDAEARRRYVTTLFRRRLHQRGFRERVLRAYKETCAMCRLAHRELLDAAHIVPDSNPEGDPVVPNGLALCKMHHAAFDKFFLAVRPDLSVAVRRDLLDETDGPMLRHGLQGLHDTKIIVPRNKRLRPDPTRLERRYNEFLQAHPG
jgi:putative restriction endonuclease